MKLVIDGNELITLSDTQKKVIQNDINRNEFEDDIKRRITYVVMHKYEQCMKRLKAEWDPKFKEAGIAMIPTDDEAYAELVFQQPNYQDREARDKGE